jgi:hypothetical protein
MTSYVLPRDHPAGRLIERLFYRSDVIENEAAFLASGFEIRRKQRRSLMRVATHPMLAGYVFKVFFVGRAGVRAGKITRLVRLCRSVQSGRTDSPGYSGATNSTF